MSDAGPQISRGVGRVTGRTGHCRHQADHLKRGVAMGDKGDIISTSFLLCGSES